MAAGREMSELLDMLPLLRDAGNSLSVFDYVRGYIIREYNTDDCI